MPLSQEQENRIDDFIESYNAIEKYLEEAVKRDRYMGFTSLVRDFQQQHGAWEDAQSVLEMARLRNVIVHNLTEPYEYLSVPTEETLANIQAIRQRLVNPVLAEQLFAKKVVTVACHDSFSDVLKLIKKTGHSRFPVYEHRRFCGLLTENTITHWISRNADYRHEEIALKDQSIESILQINKRRINYKFIAKATRVEEARMFFLDDSKLEALLMTKSGEVNQALLGIATRWDVLRIKSE